MPRLPRTHTHTTQPVLVYVAFEGRPTAATNTANIFFLLHSTAVWLCTAQRGAAQRDAEHIHMPQQQQQEGRGMVMKHHLTMETPTSDTPSHQPMIRKPLRHTPC